MMAHPLRAAAVLLAAAILAAAPGASACRAVGTGVYVAPTAGKPAKPVLPEAFDRAGVQQHFGAVGTIGDFRPDLNSTFSCIDSRTEGNMLGTPGGDLAELAAAIQAYFDLVGTPKPKDKPAEVFSIAKAFMEQVVSPDRPFYYHTSDEKLHKVFRYLAEKKGVKPRPTVLPSVAPSDPKLLEAWLDGLSNGHYQGCGHIRLMMEEHKEYGLATDDIPRELVKSFYKYYWPTPIDSKQRQNVEFSIMQGPLNGDAIAIVTSEGACPGWSPALPPSFGASQVFIFHKQAVEDFRANTIAPFFVRYAKDHGKKLDRAEYTKKLAEVQARHLAATLKLLEPANGLPIWSVRVDAKPTGPAPLPVAAASVTGTAAMPPRAAGNTRSTTVNVRLVPGAAAAVQKNGV